MCRLSLELLSRDCCSVLSTPQAQGLPCHSMSWRTEFTLSRGVTPPPLSRADPHALQIVPLSHRHHYGHSQRSITARSGGFAALCIGGVAAFEALVHWRNCRLAFEALVSFCSGGVAAFGTSLRWFIGGIAALLALSLVPQWRNCSLCTRFSWQWLGSDIAS